MIVRDEEAQLGDCLTSVAPWVDEMVVCDTGSSDGTVALATRLGARVVRAAWREDFAAARNEAMAHATGDWVLSLDADEVLAADAGPRLRALASKMPSPIEPCIYQLRVRHHLDTRDPSQVTEQDFGRLFTRHPRLHWVGPIHEYVTWRAGAPGERLLVLHAAEVVVEHHGHAAGPRLTHDKAGRNIALLRRAMAQAPQDGYFAFKLAQQQLERGHYAEAATLARGGIDLALPRAELAHDWLGRAYVCLAAAYLAGEQIDAAAVACQQGLARLPTSASLAYQLGTARLLQGRLAEAEVAFAGALARASNRDTALDPDPGMTSWRPLLGLGAVAELQGNGEVAVERYQAARQHAPCNSEAALALAGALEGLARWPEAAAVLRDVLARRSAAGGEPSAADQEVVARLAEAAAKANRGRQPGA